ncbi:MAG: hypothetical protein QF664_12255 [Dehalococcoidia bacterium]|nr:hypothetical protein [Dehalococcoidia bacterium]
MTAAGDAATGDAAGGDTGAYAEQRSRDWAAFEANSEPLTDYWEAWAERSHGWRVPIEFLQPIGLDSASFAEPLRPLLDALEALDEVDVIPIEWMHLTTVNVGLLMSTDIMWSQVETFYVNASPRVRRIAPFELALGGVSVTEDGVYLGVEDAQVIREVRRQLRLGVPKVHEVLRDDPLIGSDGDGYVPTIQLAYFTGEGERGRVLEALEPHRDIAAGTVTQTHIKMARIPIQPTDHYTPIDVVAEIVLLGDGYRKGYHN